MLFSKNFTHLAILALAVSLFFACDDSGTAPNEVSDPGHSSTSATSSPTSYNSSQSSYSGPEATGVINVVLDGSPLVSDSIMAYAPVDLGVDTGLMSIANNVFQMGTYYFNDGDLEPNSFYLNVKDPVIGVNTDIAFFTSYTRVYSSDSTRIWLVDAEESSVTFSDLNAEGAAGTMNLQLSEICFMCEYTDSAITITGDFDVQF